MFHKIGFQSLLSQHVYNYPIQLTPSTPFSGQKTSAQNSHATAIFNFLFSILFLLTIILRHQNQSLAFPLFNVHQNQPSFSPSHKQGHNRSPVQFCFLFSPLQNQSQQSAVCTNINLVIVYTNSPFLMLLEPRWTQTPEICSS